MSPAQRLLRLLEVLRRYRRPVAGAVLAAELGVSLRSIYRDIAALQAQGANIEGAAGVGYVLRPGFTLPPLMFGAEEIEALVLGARWVAANGDDALADAARAALAKILAVLPPDLRDAAEGSGLLVGPAGEATRHLRPIRVAIQRERKLVIDYRDRDGAATRRTIWPIALGFFEKARVVAAWCELREGLRHFRTDRIVCVTPTDTRYPVRRAKLLAEWRRSEGIATPPLTESVPRGD
jgi:predicted DNA-binding transcriptional regulator YafY